jgi:hypothetical protein
MKLYPDRSNAMDALSRTFAAIIQRTQLQLTLATLALTITGFSGPKIAASNNFSRYTLGIGLVLSLFSILVALRGVMHIRWLTQFTGESDEITFLRIIEYRDMKTKLFKQGLLLLVAGLAFYVSSVVGFLVYGPIG